MVYTLYKYIMLYILVRFRGAYFDFLPKSKAQSDAIELTVSEHIGYFYSWCSILSLPPMQLEMSNWISYMANPYKLCWCVVMYNFISQFTVFYCIIVVIICWYYHFNSSVFLETSRPAPTVMDILAI